MSAATEPTATAARIAPLIEAVELNPRPERGALPDDLEVSFVPMAAVEAATGRMDPSTVRPFGEVKKGYTLFREGDVLFAKITPCMENGKMAVARGLSNGVGCGSTEFHVLRPRPGVDPHYVYHFVSSARFRAEAAHHMTGAVGQKRVPATFLEQCEIPLPHLDDQRRIVADIEKQFSRLDEAVANLKRVKANLKRYKATVVKAAVEGRLVPTEAELALREGRSYESGAQLLTRILGLRHAQASGRAKLREVVGCDEAVLAALPVGWTWVSCDQLLEGIEAGASFKCVERPPLHGETGVLKVSAVTWGEFNEEESKTCVDFDRIEERFLVHPGDFLFSRANTIELVGACVIVRSVKKRLMLSDKTLRFRLVPLVLPEWLLTCLRSELGRSEIMRLATGNQESMRNIGQDRIRQIRIPLPPPLEQRRILAELEQRFSVADSVALIVKDNLIRAVHLSQATLARQFGDLGVGTR